MKGSEMDARRRAGGGVALASNQGWRMDRPGVDRGVVSFDHGSTQEACRECHYAAIIKRGWGVLERSKERTISDAGRCIGGGVALASDQGWGSERSPIDCLIV